MEFLKSIQNRYTTKMYDASKKVDASHIDKLKQILHLSPSSVNSQPWQFVFVENGALKEQFAKASHFNEPKISKASHLVVFRVANTYEQILPRLNEGQTKYFEANIKPLPEKEIKAWMAHQVYLALGVFLSACAQMNIDSTPMEGVDNKAFDILLQDDDYSTLFAVALGYRDAEDFNHPDKNPKSRLPIDEVIKEI